RTDNSIHVNGRAASSCRAGDDFANALAQTIAPERIKAKPALIRWFHRINRIVAPILGDLDGVVFHEMLRQCEVFAEISAAVLDSRAPLVMAQAISVILRQEELRIINEEAANRLLPVGKDQSIRPSMIGEVQAAIIVASLLPVKEVETMVIPIETSCVIVNSVKDHSDAVKVEKVNHYLELID